MLQLGNRKTLKAVKPPVEFSASLKPTYVLGIFCSGPYKVLLPSRNREASALFFCVEIQHGDQEMKNVNLEKLEIKNNKQQQYLLATIVSRIKQNKPIISYIICSKLCSKW